MHTPKLWPGGEFTTVGWFTIHKLKSVVICWRKGEEHTASPHMLLPIMRRVFDL
jgi:hypothetical protein